MRDSQFLNKITVFSLKSFDYALILSRLEHLLGLKCYYPTILRNRQIHIKKKLILSDTLNKHTHVRRY